MKLIDIQLIQNRERFLLKRNIPQSPNGGHHPDAVPMDCNSLSPDGPLVPSRHEALVSCHQGGILVVLGTGQLEDGPPTLY